MSRPPVPTKIVLAAIIVLVFAGSYVARQRIERAEPGAPQSLGRARRIVSMAPSITETLYALELGDRVVGVSRFCSYPAEVNEKPRIGGYYDPNFEAIVALKADLVVMLEGHQQNQPAFDKLGLPTLTVRHTSIEGILDSITSIGDACGAGERAGAIVEDIQARLARIQRKTAGRPRPRVMFAIDRTLDVRGIEDVYVAGHDGHIDRIIELAGGRNALDEGTARFPVVSSEGILKINPEVIVDLVPGLAARFCDSATVRADWDQLSQVEAVRTGRVHVIDDDYAYVPGPRFVLLVEKLAHLIHPEVDWSTKKGQNSFSSHGLRPR